MKTQGAQIVNESGQEVILRGIGLGGWMLMEGYMMQSSDVADTQHEFRDRLEDLIGIPNTDAFFDAWLANHVTKPDIDSMASWGYNSVRLPMHYNLFTLPIEEEPVTGENTWLDKGFDLTDSLLSWCASNNIYLILDLHAAPGGQGYNAAICDYDPSKPSLWESVENRNKTVALWEKLANRYKDEPWIGGYDLINEVNWDLPGNVMLRNLYEEITEAIRNTGDEHIIFIEGNWFANDFTGLTPPWDDNMAYSFHKYWNYNDQGSIQWVLDLRQQYNVPLWMGESGENSNVWFTDAISLFEGNNIGWSWWPMKRIETIVSPFSILFNQGYKDILAYWRNEGPEPTATEAFEAMMELANNANSGNCLYRKDVHDAKIRQVHTDQTIPYTDHIIPGVIHLSDFDLGRYNKAYYDVDVANYSQSTGTFQPWNSGWHYRNDGVDIESNNDDINSNGFHVGFVQKGEWMNYTVNILDSASFSANVRYASPEDGGQFHISLDGQEVIPTQSVLSTGSWQTFADLTVSDVILYEGEHVLTFHIDNLPAFNISSLDFTETGTIQQVPFMAINGQTSMDEKSIDLVLNHPVSQENLAEVEEQFVVLVNGEQEPVTEVFLAPDKDRTLVLSMQNFKVYTDLIEVSYMGNDISSVSGDVLDPFSGLKIRNTLPIRFILPALIQAENYDFMQGMGTEETSDLGGGLNLGWTDPGDYADYLIFVEEEGFFQINLRVASLSSAGKIGFFLINSELEEVELCTVDLPVTGGWQTWTTTAVNTAIPDGAYTLRMKVLSGGFNLNWFSFNLLNSIEDKNTGSIGTPLIYPSPVKSDQAFVKFQRFSPGNVLLDILTLSGKLVCSDVLNPVNNIASINLAGLPKGIYILKFQSENRVWNSKLIRQ